MNDVVKTNYAWTQEDENSLLAYVDYAYDNGIDFPTGSVCMFIPFTKNIGAKLYRNEESRRDALVNQMVAHNHGLGPKCGTPFEIYVFNRLWYGYLTEIVERVQYEGMEKWCEIEDSVSNAYDEKGFSFYDWHYTNVGIVNGKYVVIDFDGRYFKCNDNTIDIS